jgi:hypothetical protein
MFKMGVVGLKTRSEQNHLATSPAVAQQSPHAADLVIG